METEAPTQDFATPEVTITYRLAIAETRAWPRGTERVFVHEQKKGIYVPLTNPVHIPLEPAAYDSQIGELQSKTVSEMLYQAVKRNASNIELSNSQVLGIRHISVEDKVLLVLPTPQTELETILRQIQQTNEEENLGITTRRI